MTLFKDHLRDEARFYTPTPDSHQTSTSGINEAEVGKLSQDWKPKEARCDAKLVNTLIQVLDGCLDDRPLPAHLDGYFREMYKDDSEIGVQNTSKADVSHKFDALLCVTSLKIRLGSRHRILWSSQSSYTHHERTRSACPN